MYQLSLGKEYISCHSHPQATYPIPEETQRVARAAFPRGNIYMQVADRLGHHLSRRAVRGALPDARSTHRGASAPGPGHRPPVCGRACPTAKRRMPSAAALIGNMSWGWN